MILNFHKKFLYKSIEEAKKAARKNEVPIGAVIVDRHTGKIIARGHNQPISKNDPTAHAEIVALRKAAKRLKNYRLNNCTIYVTIEPCLMCAGAILNARIKEIVYGASDPKAGGCEYLPHKIKIIKGILEKECKTLLQDFFRSKRNSMPKVSV